MTLYRHAPYEYSALGGGLLFTAGACPLDGEGHVVAPGNLESQAARTVENLIGMLTEAGTGPEALLRTTIYVIGTERADLVRVWDVVAARLGRVPSALIGVSLLGYPDQLVEIEAVAVANVASNA